MRPVSADSHGPAPPPPPEILSRPPNLPADPLLPTSEMSLLQALGPVQSWLGQELEKCGIDAMIYTRYVLSLLLHDSYDYDLQDQENDIFLGLEKGAGKKWSRSKKRGGTDLMSLEEMKKQAAVQCLRSASDENSGIESLVEELCSKLKDLQNKQKEEKQIRKKSEGSQSPERAESPSSKDQVEMYYEAFPPLSEKPVCLQEIMTVWNKAKASYSSSSSSAAPQTSTDTSSPKDCTSDGDTAAKDRSLEAASGGGINATAASSNNNERAPPPAVQRRSKKEKENRYHGATTTTAGGEVQDRSTVYSKRQTRHRSEGKYRPRSWSSGSSEEGSSSSGGGNQGDSKSFKAVRIRHKSREAAAATRGKRVRSSAGQVKLALKVIDRDERRNTGGSSSSTAGTGPAPPAARHSQLYKKGKRPLKEIRSKDPGWGGEQAKEPGGGGVDEAKQEYMEEPLWYTEPITEYFVPFSSRSKLETTYRSKVDSPDDDGDGLSLSADLERLPERIQGICIANDSYQRTYLAAGSFVDGHFVEGLVDDVEEEEEEEDEADLTGTSSCCPQPEDGKDLDDEHLSEFTHFYEVDIYQSILDTSASDAIQESRILSMIRQKSVEQRDLEAECCLVLDGLQLQQPGESAIRADSRQEEEEAPGSDGFLMQDLENMAQVWGCYSPSSSEDIDGESFAGDSPVRLSPLLDSVSFTLSRLSGTLEEEEPQRVPGEAPPGDPPGGLSSSCFSLFELQYESPTFPFPRDSLTVGQENNNNNATDSSSCLDPHSNKQSRLLIWTKNSAFDETEHCSNLSTRTCSPWSHSEETRSDNEQGSAQIEDPSLIIGNEEINCIIPPLSGTYLEEEILEFLQEDAGCPCEEVKVQTLTKKSKLESICGIALEEDESMPVYDTGMFSDNANQPSEEYSSGIIKDIWTAIGDDGGNPGETSQPGGGAEKQPSEGLFSSEEASGGYHCGCLEVHAPKGAPAALQGGPLQQTKAVQRSEYHLWESKKEEQGLPVAKNKLSSSSSSSKPVDAVGAGDYMTPSKVPWDTNADKDGTSFILGGVYGELKTLSGDKNWAVTVPPGGKQDSLLQCAAAAAASAAATGTGGTAADMVTITGTDLFMNAAGTGCFAPGHRALWRPLVSFGQSDHHHQAIKGGSSAAAADALNKGFSFIFHEDLLGGFHHHGGDERGSGLDYPFSSFSLNNPFSQVLHVECSFEPEDMASFSPGFKPKSILCSDSESEAATTAAAFHPRLYGINRTQYRAIRISPRTHFRPISASELSPGGGSDSEEAESEKEEAAAAAVRLPPAPAPPADVFDDPQADLKPLEEDAECEGPYYGKSELESGKFLPRLKKSGMEKSAQTSLDSQEGSSSAALLLPIAEQEICLDCEMAAAAAAASSSSSTGAGRTDAPAVSEVQREESPGEKENCSPGAPPSGPIPTPKYGIACDFVADVAEFPLNLSGQGGASDQQDESWWQNTLCSPLFPGSQCTGRSNI